MNFLSIVTGPIVDGVLKGLKEMRALKQFEAMQGEILEGWIYKIKIAVERELKAHRANHETYEAVMKAIDKVVEEEFDTRKL